MGLSSSGSEGRWDGQEQVPMGGSEHQTGEGQKILREGGRGMRGGERSARL